MIRSSLAATVGSVVTAGVPIAASATRPPSSSGMRPFRIDFGARAIADLHRRLDATRWPEMPFDTGWTQGTSDRVLRDLAAYWRRTYDWRAVQRDLNTLTHLRGPIGGEQLHCVVYKASGAGRGFPLLMMSG